MRSGTSNPPLTLIVDMIVEKKTGSSQNYQVPVVKSPTKLTPDNWKLKLCSFTIQKIPQNLQPSILT